jgi:uncharacterized protein YbjT (DUF2867 family)
VKADATKYDEIRKATLNVDIIYYLIHSMEGSAKGWAKFARRDYLAAENFTKAASENNVKRIIYLGGLSQARSEELSEHMRSRREVGDILRASAAKVTIFNAAIILGKGGKSFEMLHHLVVRFPVLFCPKWVKSKTQPIAVDDVIEYLTQALEVKETMGRTFEIGGPNIITYLDMMKRYARVRNKTLFILINPFLSLRLASYWINILTPIKSSIARPLLDSLRQDAIVKDDSIRKLIPIKLKTFEEAVQQAQK